LHSLYLNTVQIKFAWVLLQLEVFNWVLLSKISEKLEVNKLKYCSIELKECAHNLIVNIKWKTLVELIRGYPSDWLTHDFNLIVNTLDWKEGLLKALSHCAIEHKLLLKSLAFFDLMFSDLKTQMLRETCEQADETESVIQISQGINESWIPFLDDMTQSILGSLRQMFFSHLSLLASKQLLVFLDMSLDLSELVKQFIMHQDLQVLNMIVCLVGTFELLLGLARINTFQDAEASEIL